MEVSKLAGYKCHRELVSVIARIQTLTDILEEEIDELGVMVDKLGELKQCVDKFFEQYSIVAWLMPRVHKAKRRYAKYSEECQEKLGAVNKTKSAIHITRKSILKIDGIEEMIADLIDKDRKEANAWIIFLNQIKKP